VLQRTNATTKCFCKKKIQDATTNIDATKNVARTFARRVGPSRFN